MEIGEGLKLPHPQGIIIGKGVKIGEDVTIYQQVTLGGRGKATESNLAVHERYPHIGSHVILYAGCKVVGHIELADGTIIGANAVLNKSTETGQTYVGVPAYNKASLEDKNVTHKKHV